jgi:hypothetical protein
LISFETEYDLHIRNSENKNVPSFLIAKISPNPEGLDYKLLTCSTIDSERFFSQAKFLCNFAYV